MRVQLKVASFVLLFSVNMAIFLLSGRSHFTVLSGANILRSYGFKCI